jgi:hypothetical protein
VKFLDQKNKTNYNKNSLLIIVSLKIAEIYITLTWQALS